MKCHEKAFIKHLLCARPRLGLHPRTEVPEEADSPAQV